eukprot:4156276-Amphidinium_carterae.1
MDRIMQMIAITEVSHHTHKQTRAVSDTAQSVNKRKLANDINRADDQEKHITLRFVLEGLWRV